MRVAPFEALDRGSVGQHAETIASELRCGRGLRPSYEMMTKKVDVLVDSGMAFSMDFNELTRKLDDLTVHPDLAWGAARIADLIASVAPEPREFSELVERYSSSMSPAIVAALAAVNLKTESPYLNTIDEALRYSELIKVNDVNVLALCLEIMTRNIARLGRPLDLKQFRRLESFVVTCLEFSGEHSFLVAIGIVDLLDKLHFFGTSLKSFRRDHLSLLREWLALFIEREGDGPFAEQAHAVLQQVDSEDAV